MRHGHRMTRPDAPRKFFGFGLGYTGEYLARRSIDGGGRVAGTTRNAEKCARLRAFGIDAHVFAPAAVGREISGPAGPLDDAATALADTTHLLSAVPPDEAGDPVLRGYAAEIAGIGGLRWIGYLSTTGVYGNRDGAWVDEDTPPNPSSARARCRVRAEAAWRDLGRQCGIGVHIFRLAGIYGPGRSALDTVRAGTARRIVKPGQIFSRIHIEDIARVLEASMAHPASGYDPPGRVYNVCDDDPAPPQDVVAYACELLGVEPPPEISFESAELSPMARSFYLDNKRVDNRRMKRELEITLCYPSYREGLGAQLAQETKSAP